MKSFLVLVFLAIACNGLSQKHIYGIILDKEKNQPVSRASIFLNNTSIGTTSDDAGKFVLFIPSGKFELIVSSIGYESFYRVISSSDEENTYTIHLLIKSEQMEEVVITPYEKDGWKNWGRFFTESFIGTIPEAGDCRILNTDVLRFRYNKTKKELFVSAREPIIIENRALGYKITYDLVHFRYDFRTTELIFAGFPFFEEMSGTQTKQKKWEKKRKEVYQGSRMHFMRNLFANTLKEEGFEIRRLKKLENLEKARVKLVMAALVESQRKGNQVSLNETDSSEYYRQVLRSEDYHSIIGREALPADSIAYGIDNETAGLFFEDFLLVSYRVKNPPALIQQTYNMENSPKISELTLTGGKPIEIKSNGMYYDSLDLLTLRYWAWSEKIASMLPFDYEIPAEKK